jgi:hypothetical protein
MNTYWLGVNRGPGSVSFSTGTHSSASEGSYGKQEMILPETPQRGTGVLSTESSRLVDWNVEILTKVLKQIIARREVLGVQRESLPREMELEQSDDTDVRHRVAEVMDLPPFDHRLASLSAKANSIKLPAAVEAQLHLFVEEVAKLYNDNPFHNFSHGTLQEITQKRHSHDFNLWLRNEQQVMSWFVKHARHRTRNLTSH